jgi:hypothetical protein
LVSQAGTVRRQAPTRIVQVPSAWRTTVAAVRVSFVMVTGAPQTSLSGPRPCSPLFGQVSVQGAKVRGNTTFFSWYDLGVVAARSANPSQPRLRAQFVPDTDYINPDFFCTEPCAQVWGVALHRASCSPPT